MTFDIGLHELVYGWTGVRYVITKFSRLDSLPNFLTHGAPLRARFAHESSAKNNIKRIYNYSLRSIAAFCSARKDLKTLCLKLASEPLFLILAFMQFQSFIVLIVKVRPPSVFRFYLGHTKFMFECLLARL